MAAGTDRRAAAGAAEVLGILAGRYDDAVGCERWLCRAVALDPSREQAWDLLWAVLAHESHLPEIVTLLDKQRKQKDGAHYRFLLAKSYEELQQWERAEEAVRAGLKLEPDHFLLRLCEAALLLRKGDEASLAQAGKVLDGLKDRLGEGAVCEDRKSNYRVVRDLARGLTGSPEVARQTLEQMRQRQVEDVVAALEQAGATSRQDDGLPGKPIVAVTLEDHLLSRYSLGRLRWLPRLQKLAIEPGGVTDEDLRYLGKLPALTDLRLYGSKITDNGLGHLRGLKTLRSLRLHGTEVTGEGLGHLAALPALERLDLEGSSITDEGLRQLRSLPRLRDLALDETLVTDVGLAHLRHVPDLERLSLAERPADLPDEGGSTITGKRMAAIGRLKKLRYLSIRSGHLTDEGLGALRGLTQLEELSLHGAAITDAWLAPVAGLERLRRLDVSGSPITDKGLASLKGMAQLRELNLDGTAVGDAGLVHLEGLARLRRLGLANTAVTEAGLAHLAKLSGLRVLDLTYWHSAAGAAGGSLKAAVSTEGFRCLGQLAGLESLILDGRTVEPEGLSQLRKLSRLRSLSLSFADLGDADVAALGTLTQLERLELAGNALTDEGLKHLLPLKRLTFINLNGTRVTDKGLDALREAIPKITIRRWE